MVSISTSTKLSLLLHAALLTFFLLLALIDHQLLGPQIPKNTPMKVRVVEAPLVQNAPPPKIQEVKSLPEIEVKVTNTIQEKISTKKSIRKVFGVNRQSLTREGIGESGEGFKQGNTLAKSPDQEKLTKDDPDFLEAPAAEFLVSEMPRLISEYRVPYPSEAKNNNIEGTVIMDIYVDTEGHVRESILVSGPGYGLNEAALEAIKKFKFTPAKVGQNNVNFRLRYSYRFVLEK